MVGRALAVMGLAGWLALAGCGKSEDPPPSRAQAGPRGAAAARPDRPADARTRPRTRANPASGRDVAAGAAAPFSQPAATGPRGEYLATIEQKISAATEQGQALADGIGGLPEQWEARWETLLTEFDRATNAARERLDDLAAAPGPQRDEKQRLLDRALAQQQRALAQLENWVAAAEKMKSRP